VSKKDDIKNNASSEAVELAKAEASTSPSAMRIRTGEIGIPYQKAAGSWVQVEMRRELQAPYNLITYDKMRQDATVGAALGTAEAFLTKALAKAKFVTHSKNPESKEFCDYLNWNLKNFTDCTWYDSVINMLTYLQYGFSWLEKVYEPNFSIKHKKYPWKIKKLAPRSQQSVSEWKFDENNRNVLWLRQYPAPVLNMGYVSTTAMSADPLKERINRNKFMLFSWDSKNNNPLGVSPLNGCYRAWKEKVLIESMEVTGAAKGLNGIVTLRVPTEHINKAASDAESDEAKTLRTLQDQAALMHSGDQTYILLGSDVQGENGNGKYAYDFELKGVEGGGSSKTVTTADIINERKKAILDVFGAGFINIGNDGTGSYSLADAKTSLHAFFMEKHMIFIQSVIQNDLVKQMMELNGVVLEEQDIPVFELATLDEVDPEIVSAAVQRVGSVGLIPRKKDFLLDLWNKCGFDVSSLEDLTEEDLLEAMVNPENESRGGEGLGTSGTGTTQSGGKGSKINAGNKA
jgi:hypothetical protein